MEVWRQDNQGCLKLTGVLVTYDLTGNMSDLYRLGCPAKVLAKNSHCQFILGLDKYFNVLMMLQSGHDNTRGKQS